MPVFPVSRMCDRLAFPGFHAHARLQPKMTQESMFENSLPSHDRRISHVTVVLGAGNASSIPATDVMGKIFQHNQAVLLKLSPVNEYLRPIFEQAFKPLIDRGYLRIVRGGAAIGADAIASPVVQAVHVTGSIARRTTRSSGAHQDQTASGGSRVIHRC